MELRRLMLRIAALILPVICLALLSGKFTPATADEGTGTPAPPVTTVPNVTKHDTTYDNIAPTLDENDANAGYLDGNSVPFSCYADVIPGGVKAQWQFVNGSDIATTLEGQVTSSKLSWDDNPIDHHSRDRNFFILPDPDFVQLLAKPGNFHEGDANEFSRMEVEWETAAFPSWALPMMGDWAHVEGAYIWDCAHGDNGFRTEIHPPRLVMTLRDWAGQWSKGNVVLPARPGWADTMPGMGSIPVPVTRADIFASSDGGEAREQETCFNLDPIGCTHNLDWYQPLKSKNYDLFVPAPTKPTDNAQLITKIIHHPFVTCSSDDDCGGALDVFGPGPNPDPNRIILTVDNGPKPGVHVHIDFDGFKEPSPSFLYGFGFTLEVGWDKRVPIDLHRVKVTAQSLHVTTTLDIGLDDDEELEVNALIGDTFRHMQLTGNGVVYNSHQDVPYSEEVNVGDYGFKSSGPECALDAPGGADPGPCQSSFEVTLLPGQPLRVFFRSSEHDPENENDEAGTVEHIFQLADNYGIGTHTEGFQERTSAGADALDTFCGNGNPPCQKITYKIEDDPFPQPASTTLTVGSPSVVVGGQTWVTSATALTLQATPPAGHEGDAIEIHEQFFRSGIPAPSDTVCNTPGTTSCTLYLNANDGADGAYTVAFWSVDTTTGAVEGTQSQSFQLDNTAPTSSSSLSGSLVRGWYNTAVGVTLSASDGSGVGVDHISYSVDGGASTTYSAPFTVSGDSASHTVQYAAQDKLTNTESPSNQVSFKIDTTSPNLAVTNASDGAFSYTQDELVNGIFTDSSSLDVSYSASDALSGLYAVRLDGMSSAAGSGTFTTALPAGISSHTLEAEDVAGNLKDLTFLVVSVPPGTFSGGVAPQGGGFWKNAVSGGAYSNSDLAGFLLETDVASQAFGGKLNRYADATLANYGSYLSVNPNSVTDLKVRRELLAAWLNFVSGREPPKQSIDVKSVSGWATVVQNTAGSSKTTALNLVREVERRLGESPSTALLQTIQTLLEKLNGGNLNK